MSRIQLIGEIYMVARPDLIKHVLQDNHLNYRKGRMYEAVKPLVGLGLLTSEGDFWKRQRRLAQPGFHRQRIAAFGTMMTERTGAVLDRWDAMAEAGVPFDLHGEMMALTLTIVGEALFGVDLSGSAADVGRALGTALEITDKRFRLPLLLPKWVPTPQNVRFNRAMRVLDGLVDRIIAERHASPKEHDDLLGMLMAARDEDGQPMSDRQLSDEVMTMLLAGHETTANALTWWVYLLALNSEAEQRLTAEVQTVLEGRVPRLEDLPALGFTRRSFDEAMRLYPPAHAIGRKAIADDTLDGFRIPAGSTLFLSSFVMGRDPRVLGRAVALRSGSLPPGALEGSAGAGDLPLRHRPPAVHRQQLRAHGDAPDRRDDLPALPAGAGPRTAHRAGSAGDPAPGRGTARRGPPSLRAPAQRRLRRSGSALPGHGRDAQAAEGTSAGRLARDPRLAGARAGRTRRSGSGIRSRGRARESRRPRTGWRARRG